MRSSGAWAAAAGAARVWTQRVGAFVTLPQLIEQLGGNVAQVLSDAGVAPADLSHPENRVAYSSFVALLERAAERTNCPHFGLLAGRMWRLADLGLLGQLVRHSASVGQALDALNVYHHLNSGGGLSFLLKRGDFVDFGYAV